MFRAFNIKDVTEEVFNDWKTDGEALFSKQSSDVRSAVSHYINNGVINGLEIVGDWFGPVKADVFISHSHRDEALAIGMAGWLHEEFGLTSFIDSCVWGYADDLLLGIDKVFCKNGESNTYSYRARNRSTSHVHMMLSTALMQMIDSCEGVFFINTPAAVSTEKLLDRNSDGETSSPWIYAELVAMQLLRRREPKRRTSEAKIAVEAHAMDKMDIRYPVHLNCLTDLWEKDLEAWMSSAHRSTKKGAPQLDALYERHPERASNLEDFKRSA